MTIIRDTLKQIPPLVSAVRVARRAKTAMWWRYLQLRYPRGKFVNCNGVDVFCNFHIPTSWWYERHNPALVLDRAVMLRLVQQSQGDLFIDIGAHFGYFSALFEDFLGERNSTFEIIAMEPDRDNYRCLVETVKRGSRPNVDVVTLPVALLGADGVNAVLHKSKGDCLNVLKEEGDIPCYETEGASLDTVVRKYGKGKRVALIKIDIDGAEPLLFDGGNQVLRDHDPLIFIEFAPVWIKRFGTDPKEFFSMLASRYIIYYISYQTKSIRRLLPTDYSMLETEIGIRMCDLVLSTRDLDLTGVC